MESLSGQPITFPTITSLTTSTREGVQIKVIDEDAPLRSKFIYILWYASLQLGPETLQSHKRTNPIVPDDPILH